jgi:hypothetical protein
MLGGFSEKEGIVDRRRALSELCTTIAKIL